MGVHARPFCVWECILKKILLSAYPSSFDQIFSMSISLSLNGRSIATEGLQFFGVICRKIYTKNSLSILRSCDLAS